MDSGKICLVANYFGQAAYLLSDKFDAGKNPFFAIVPDEFLVLQVLLATLAAIIASQSFNYWIIYINFRGDKIKLIP